MIKCLFFFLSTELFFPGQCYSNATKPFLEISESLHSCSVLGSDVWKSKQENWSTVQAASIPSPAYSLGVRTLGGGRNSGAEQKVEFK